MAQFSSNMTNHLTLGNLKFSDLLKLPEKNFYQMIEIDNKAADYMA